MKLFVILHVCMFHILCSVNIAENGIVQPVAVHRKPSPIHFDIYGQGFRIVNYSIRELTETPEKQRAILRSTPTVKSKMAGCGV